MYAVFGLDWLNQKVLIDTSGAIAWHDMALFKIMEYSGLPDRKRTPEYPKGQDICVGDIIQFPITLDRKETIHKDVVVFDREEYAGFIVSELDMPLGLYADECEVIGTIYEHPELIGKAA
jgi:hypothetical protein